MMDGGPEDNRTATWPALPLGEWQDTYTTLHMWTQIVGKTRLALAPMENHWWHFFWGAFDLAATRFSGRPAPAHPGGIPNCPDWVMREAYSHECSSCGFWPGGGAIAEPAFYAYAYPEPAGYAQASVRPGAAYYHPDLREFVLPYAAVRSLAAPDDALLEFFQSSYEAAAGLAGWDRAGLEPAHDTHASAASARGRDER